MRLFVVLLFCLFPALAFAQGFSGDGFGSFGFYSTSGVVAPISGACPQGGGFPTDGCAAAPAPLTAQWQQSNAYQPGGYFNTIAGTTANYMNTNCGASGTASCRPPWNVAGVDYAIGNYTAIASLADPATMSVAGCTYSISGTGGGLLTCTGSSFLGVLQHINFGPVTGAGAHGCTALSITGHSGSVTTLLLDDLYFFNDTGLCSTGTGSNYWLQVTDFYSGGVTASNIYADLNSSVWDTKMGGCAGTTLCSPQIIDFVANSVTAKYVVVRNSAGNPLTGTHGLGQTQTFQYVWIENWNNRAPNGHAEAYDGTSGIGITPLSNAVAGGLTFDHIVILQGQNVSNFGPTPLWLASNYPFAITNGPNVTNNTVINSFVGGRPKAGVTFSGCWGGSFNGTTCGAPGASNHLFVTTETGTVGYGADVNCTGGSFVTYKSVTPTNGATEEYIVDGFSGTEYGPAYQISGSPVTCTSIMVDPHISGNAAVTSTRAATPFGSPNYSTNYIDVSSFGGSPGAQQIWQIYQVDSTVSVPSGTITTSLGVSTLNTSGVNVEYGAYVNGAGVGSCSINIQSCPQIASGSAGVYTLSVAVTPVSTEAMTVVPLSWCATQAVVANNVDMTGNPANATWVNQMSTVTSGNGC